MSALFLTESQVVELLPMTDAIEAVRGVFRKQALTEVAVVPRGRARTDHGMLHVMGAAAKTLNAMCAKVYSTTKHSSRFLVVLFEGKTGLLQAVMEGDHLGRIRTGATSGVATGIMARPNADTVGVFGSGKQARTQLEAVCRVRNITEAYVYSPNPEHRDNFAREMTATLGIKVVAVNRPDLAAEDKDIIILATKSPEPVVLSEWIAEGTHINAIGSNFVGRAEVDVELVRRCDPIVVDEKEQSKLEAGDLIRAVEAGVVRWSDIHELGNVVVNRVPGRHEESDVTLFKSVGAALEDLAVARLVFENALKQGVGTRLPF
jgi:ornithine cyclodeaminase/alanine dehydrogenase-like protein (mu-crystallin family)